MSATKMSTRRSKKRIICDPIHGDISLGELQAAIVDTRIFQRLRYIRQNGLLHFVFPGAVHTRFAHSIGTMHIAARLFQHLLAPAVECASRKESQSIDYIATVFECAALLHDVGHCAFSHSIENVEKKDGTPLLGTLNERFIAWEQSDMLREYLKVHGAEYGTMPVSHEQIGLVLVGLIFKQENVSGLCKEILKVNSSDVAQDIIAIMDGGLSPSKSFETNVRRALGAILKSARQHQVCFGESEIENPVDDLLARLHELISGTFDVDRLDYLNRDSFFCGVPYGRCSISMLLRNLHLGYIEGRLQLFLGAKAIYALEDMLWSRYQLFIQVLNHKTNVGLNSFFSGAIREAIGDDRFRSPESILDFIEFTDDFVMSKIFSSCVRGDLDKSLYAKVLVDRRFPVHLGSEQITATRNVRRIQQKHRKEKAQKLGIDEEKVWIGEAKSHFWKTSALPLILDWDRSTGERTSSKYERPGKSIGQIPRVHHIVHFYVDRDLLQERT